jgi:hypothetical protein
VHDKVHTVVCLKMSLVRCDTASFGEKLQIVRESQCLHLLGLLNPQNEGTVTVIVTACLTMQCYIPEDVDFHTGTVLYF